MLKNYIARLIEFIRPGYVPFFLAIVFTVFSLLYRLLSLPQPAELLSIADSFYAQYGLTMLLVSSFLECLFMVSFYFPGSLVILLAVYLSPHAPVPLFLIGTTCYLGFLIAVAGNYWLGRHGAYRVLLFLGRKDTISAMQKWLDKKGRYAIPLSAFNPNWLGVAATCMGIGQAGIRNTLFLSAVGLAFWVPLWTILAATLAPKINLSDPNQHWYVTTVLVTWGVWLIVANKINDERS